MNERKVKVAITKITQPFYAPNLQPSHRTQFVVGTAGVREITVEDGLVFVRGEYTMTVLSFPVSDCTRIEWDESKPEEPKPKPKAA